jgi:hypothetical protein
MPETCSTQRKMLVSKLRDLDVGGMVMLKRILETHEEGVNWIQVA